MIPLFATNQDKTTALFLLVSLSPKAQESINLELYRQTAASDESDTQYVLEQALSDTMKDLESIGIHFDLDYSPLADEVGPLFDFIYLVGHLLPNTLYPILKQRHHFRKAVSGILDGSLGEEQSVVEVYLSELGGLDGQPPLESRLYEVCDRYYALISATASFTDYLKNLMALLEQEKIHPEATADQHDQYRAYLQEMIGRNADVCNHYEATDLFPELQSIQQHLIFECIAPDQFHDLAYLFLTDPTTLPSDLQERFSDRKRWYRVSHMWCLDYYTTRGMTPTTAEQIALYAFVYARSSTLSAYKTAIAPVEALYPHPHLSDYIVSLYG